MGFFNELFSKRVLLNALAALLVAVLVLWGVFAWLDHYTCHGCSISVPDLSGFQLDMVEDIIERKDLRYVVMDSIYDENSERGAVVDQDPKAGTQVKENRRIYLIMNRSERESVKMEDVTNVSPRQAIAMLRSLGLEVGELIPKPSPYTDLVLDQLHGGEKIADGTSIYKGEKIDLVVAAGASGEKTLVPDLAGMDMATAELVLMQHSLNLGAAIACDGCETADDTMTLSRIYRQRPASHKKMMVDLGAYVDVWLTKDSSNAPSTPVEEMRMGTDVKEPPKEESNE